MERWGARETVLAAATVAGEGAEYVARTSFPICGLHATATRRAALGAVGAGITALGFGRRSAPVFAQTTPAAIPQVVERWAAAWNAHDPAAMTALFTDDGLYEDLAFGASFQGKDGVAEWVTITTSVIPDAAVDLVAAYQAGDRATAEWIFSGSQIAPPDAEGQAPGGTFSIRAASVFELEGDLIRRVSDYYNPTTVQSQPGQATPADASGEPAATPSA